MKMILSRVALSEAVGKTFDGVHYDKDAESIVFTLGKEVYHLTHEDECCEEVYVEDICGDLADLVGSPILLAEEVYNEPIPEEFNESDYESCTWTFYKFSTIKGSVTIRFFGSSNGCYGESAEFYRECQNDACYARYMN
jgi:hypothetical protein